MAKRVQRLKPKSILDMATGTGDLAFALERHVDASSKIVGMDFCEPMLARARNKKKDTNVSFTLGDCLRIALDDNSVDVITIGFGLRNLQERKVGLAEMHRVLRPGGWLIVLEFTQPDAWLKPFYWPYVRLWMPWISKKLTGQPSAYRYLGSSIAGFPSKKELSNELTESHFRVKSVTGLSGSIVAIHEAQRS